MEVTTSDLVTSKPAGVTAGTFARSGIEPDGLLAWFVDGLRDAMAANDYSERSEAGPDVQIVLQVVDANDPKPYRRKAAPTFVAAIAELADVPADQLRTGYPLLVKSLANLSVMICRSPDGPVAQFVTLEQGRYQVAHTGDDDEFFAGVFARLEPLASSRLVIANDFEPDLPESLWQGDEHTRQITRAGEKLEALDLLPAAFPIEEILEPRELRHVKLLFGIGGLSYGNVSNRRGDARTEYGPEYWMSASGVDKSNLREIGRDILLVKGYDPQRDAMVLSVPAEVKPRRVSVDAIEHWMIYAEHPEVGAILHVHAWMDGIEATHINYPCGTLELASAVAELVRRSPDPSRAVVGQRDHGLTITGHSLDEIFERVDDKLVRKVPMD